MAESGQRAASASRGQMSACQSRLTNLFIKKKDGSGDVYFSLTLKEYRYIMPQADVLSDTTGLKSRVAETGASKETTCLGTMHALDNAQKLSRRPPALSIRASVLLACIRAW